MATTLRQEGNKITWETIAPTVNAEAEFFEILNDFGDPLEILREAISNSFDAGAQTVSIEFTVENIDGANRLVIHIVDDGSGMTRDVLTRDFWGLGFSPSRDRRDAIGEKGHGTLIYLRSERVIVRTQGKEGALESICEWPLRWLARRKLHQPVLRPIEDFREGTGTELTIIGYNDNERSRFVQDVVRDYILWFTKVGSIEREFGIERHKDFHLRLKALDSTTFEDIPFGHPFPKENQTIDQLFEEKGTSAADWYVKHYVWPEERLKSHPEVTFQAVISVEGDSVKRSYNPMIRERRRSATGRYRVSDRYGLWLCKDFIPIVRVNDWITGFGSGSNAFVLLHGFVNCQHLKLTANRGTIANTDPKILEEFQSAVQELIAKIDGELDHEGLYTLRGWQEEHRTLEQEKSEFVRRVRQLKNRRVAADGPHMYLEPQSEAELFGVFMMVMSRHPELFEFQPLDYNTTRGIDIIARSNRGPEPGDGEHFYVELKYALRSDFNHSFKHIRWIVCWDFDKAVGNGTELRGIEENDVRRLVIDKDDEGRSIYFLDNRRAPVKIRVIRLKELLKQRLSMEFNLPEVSSVRI